VTLASEQIRPNATVEVAYLIYDSSGPNDNARLELQLTLNSVLTKDQGVPHIPDFLLGLTDPANFMRSRLAGTAHATMGGLCRRKSGSQRVFCTRCGKRKS